MSFGEAISLGYPGFHRVGSSTLTITFTIRVPEGAGSEGPGPQLNMPNEASDGKTSTLASDSEMRPRWTVAFIAYGPIAVDAEGVSPVPAGAEVREHPEAAIMKDARTKAIAARMANDRGRPDRDLQVGRTC